MTARDEHRSPPSNDPCWSGEWCAPTSADDFWLLAALNRTVRCLPAMHPWRLADDKGASRVMLWTGATRDGLAVLAQTGRTPDLPTGSFDTPDNAGLSQLLAFDPVRAPRDEAPCWLGGLTRMHGAWLPSVAVLPRSQRDADDPGTQWSTESVDFARRHSVHATDTRFAADVLAPHVMALVLDRVPGDAAVTMSGDALHVWVSYTTANRSQPLLAQRLVAAARDVANALPTFLLDDHRDRSDEVERELAAKAAAAEEYREQRRRSRSADPHLQRIYEAAHAEWNEQDLSSRS